MKERPILFSAPMVRALQEGRKTQTRRLIKPQPDSEASLGFVIPQPNAKGSCAHFHHVDKDGIHSHELTVYCPYGMPGDRLYVKETHAFIWPGENEPENLQDCNVEYRADTDGKSLPGDWPEESRDDPERPKWRPSIFMPRWASRILLEITDVRVERLQDISQEDAMAEGIWSLDEYHDAVERAGAIGCGTGYIPKQIYQNLWAKINGPQSWDLNPFVWVIEFKRISHEQE